MWKLQLDVTANTRSFQKFQPVKLMWCQHKQSWILDSGHHFLSENVSDLESSSDWPWDLVWRDRLPGRGPWSLSPVPFSSKQESVSWPRGGDFQNVPQHGWHLAAFVYPQVGCCETLLRNNANLYGTFSSWNHSVDFLLLTEIWAQSKASLPATGV